LKTGDKKEKANERFLGKNLVEGGTLEKKSLRRHLVGKKVSKEDVIRKMYGNVVRREAGTKVVPRKRWGTNLQKNSRKG